jgi:hypothetical protein
VNRTATALAATLALLGVFAAAALAVTPPAGTPNLGSMTVQSADLRPGSIITIDGYQAPPAGFLAVYERDFRVAQTTRGGVLFALSTQVQLTSSTAVARRVLALERTEFGSTAGHRLLVASILRSAGGKVKAKNVHFGPVVRIAPGSGSFDERVTLALGARTSTSEIIEVGHGPAIALLVAVAPGAHVPGALSLSLAGDVARHMSTVFASNGSTGTTGST